MEYRITHKGLRGFENINFAVDIVKLTKVAKNRSYPSLSPCCKQVLKQIKFCSACNKEVGTKEVTHKQFKLGKEAYPISAEHLNKIKENLDSDLIVISQFRDKAEVPEMYFTDNIYAAKQHKKYMKDYGEYAQILQMANKVAIGEFNMRGRPYPVMLFPFQNNLVVRALHFFEEVETLPTINTEVPINKEKVSLMVQALALNKSEESFDITQFVNIREEQEEELIEKVLKGEAIPEVEKIEVVTREDNDEIARLQELLKKNTELTSAATIAAEGKE